MGQLKFRAVIFSRLLKCMSEPDSHQRLYNSKAIHFLYLKHFLAPYLPLERFLGFSDPPVTISLPSRWWASPGAASWHWALWACFPGCLPVLHPQPLCLAAFSQVTVVNSRSLNKWLIMRLCSCHIFPGLIPLWHFGGLVVIICEIRARL